MAESPPNNTGHAQENGDAASTTATRMVANGIASMRKTASAITTQNFDDVKSAVHSAVRVHASYLELFAVFLWMAMMPFAMVCQLVTLFCPLLWPYWLYIQFDGKPEQGGNLKMWSRKLPIWHLFRSYFPVKLYSETTLDPQNNKNKNYFLIAHPHGIMPLGLWCNISTEANGISREHPGVDFRICTLPSNFKIPFLRELLMWLGCIPVSEKSIRWLLTHPSPIDAPLHSTRPHGDTSENGYDGDVKDNSRRRKTNKSKPGKKAIAVVDVVGGSAESLDQEPGTARLTLKRRRGYLRIAISTSSYLVPVFTFRENDLFEQKYNPWGSTLRICQEAGRKLLGMSPTLFWGRGMREGSEWGWVPYRREVTTVIGKPIDVEEIVGKVESDDDITEEMMEKVKMVYIKELKGLYDRWKDKLNPDREEDMEIVA